MASAAVERVLGGLEHVRRSGGGWMARCPAHEDRSPSLAISEGDDGRVLLYCHAGCSFEQIVAALGLRPGELFPGSWTNGDRLHSLPKPSPPTRTVSPATLDRMRRLTRPKWTRESEPRSEVPSLTLAQYADHFKLPVDFLRKAGLEDSTWKDRDWTEPRPAVRIPYRDEAGNVVAIRYRFALGKSGFRWQKGARSCLYGLPGLAAARKAGFVTLCEGESDTQVLRFHRFPAVGVPGASTWRDEWAADLEGLRVYLVQEPDQG
ncbi:MAG: hypothetical protein ACREMD_15500, partial [Gemmatimonadota bacterium]